jgi:Bacterial SH3 domain
MPRRTFGVLFLVLLALTVLAGCSGNPRSARGSAAATPTRTPRPTWTPARGGVSVTTPTLDPTRYPGVQLAAAAPATPQQLVPGSADTIFVPVGPSNGSGVQTVVVIIVTATPSPMPTETPLPPTSTPGPTFTPGPPTPTPTPSQTPLPPVVVTVQTDKANVRSGPGQTYPLVAQLPARTQITVVGRNRAGTWWKVCCVNGSDAWIADSLVTVEGPVWTVAEVTNIPAAPPPPPTKAPPPTVAPTPTFAWPFRVESTESYPLLGDNILRVNAKVYNGAVLLGGYKLRIRRQSTGEEWTSDPSMWGKPYWEAIEFPIDGKPVVPSFDCETIRREGLRCIPYNVKWDSNQVSVPPGDDVWEVTLLDGGGQPVSAAVRVETNAAAPKWHYIVFNNKS